MQAIFISRSPRKRSAFSGRRRRAFDRASNFELLEARQLLSASAIKSHTSHTEYTLYSSNGLKPASSSAPVGLTPSQIQNAYGINLISFNGGIVGNGAGETIAIVDAYHDPTIQTDLQTYDTAFGLPAPPSFIQVAEDGSTNYPTTDPSGKQGAGDDTWEIEEALDVEWAHAIAPDANILLVEASSTSDADLFEAAVNYARNYPGVTAVSMSFSGSEFSTESSLDSYFTTPSGHSGVTFLAATGDDGQPSGYPAYSPNVIAVGGTTLSTDAAGDYLGETGWSDSGGGVSKDESQPSYQSGVVTQSITQRTNPDVSLDANPSSGVAVYDSYDFGTADGWIQVGGTSLATPMWAGLIAIADQGRSLDGLGSLDGRSQTLPLLYQLPSSDFHDITSGNNGYAAGTGYDLVTGLGSPKANLVVAGLLGASISGNVYNDTNANGDQNSGEGGQAGVTVYDDVDDNGVFDPATQVTYNSTDAPVTIPDLTTITSILQISGVNASMDDVNVEVNITHTYDSDLVITLISPNGTQIVLASHDGRNGHNYTNTIFDEQASSSIANGRAPFTGSYIPIESLAVLNGGSADGTWTLQVADTVAQDSGTLNSWSLQITTGSDVSTTTDANGNYEFVNLAPGVHYIREVTPANDTETAPASGVYDVVVAAGANITGLNFGNAPAPAVVTSVVGDFDRNGSFDAGDIPAAMMALTNLDEYLATYQVTPQQLATYDDVNHDGTFNNADLQALLTSLISQGGGSSSSAAQQTVGSATPTSNTSVEQSATQLISKSAIVSEGYTDPRPIASVSAKHASAAPKSVTSVKAILLQDVQEKLLTERSSFLRTNKNTLSFESLEKFFEDLVA